jgi:hypothetical protein
MLADDEVSLEFFVPGFDKHGHDATDEVRQLDRESPVVHALPTKTQHLEHRRELQSMCAMTAR